MKPKIRMAVIRRETTETTIEGRLVLDGQGVCTVETGIGFFDHMLTTWCKHGRFDLVLTCRGDLEVDDHHTVEDCALAIGEAVDCALGERRNIVRFASAFAPLDEALARAVVDISGRPYAAVTMGLRREYLGKLSCENVSHFFSSLASAARLTLHLDVLRGENDHHRCEAAFKAVALALREALAVDLTAAVPSTKGVL